MTETIILILSLLLTMQVHPRTRLFAPKALTHIIFGKLTKVGKKVKLDGGCHTYQGMQRALSKIKGGEHCSIDTYTDKQQVMRVLMPRSYMTRKQFRLTRTRNNQHKHIAIKTLFPPYITKNDLAFIAEELLSNPYRYKIGPRKYQGEFNNIIVSAYVNESEEIVTMFPEFGLV